MLMHAFFAGVIVCAAFARRHKCFLQFSTAMLFLFAALRYGFGNDYFSYYRCFLEIRQMGANPFPGEPLFAALNGILPHYYCLIVLTSLLLVRSLYGLTRQNVPLKWTWLAVAVLIGNPYLFLMNLWKLQRKASKISLKTKPNLINTKKEQTIISKTL